MESRKLTAVVSATNSTITFMSEAETVGELKVDLVNQGINLTNMDIHEGLTKTQLINNDDLLPRNVEYKGNTTNELVLLITNTNKKIASGAVNSRKEAYEYIKEHNLSKPIQEKYERNYTNVNTDALIIFCNNDEDCRKSGTCTEKAQTQLNDGNMTKLYEVRDLLSKTIRVLDTIMSSTDATQSPYTDDEITEMFNNINR